MPAALPATLPAILPAKPRDRTRAEKLCFEVELNVASVSEKPQVVSLTAPGIHQNALTDPPNVIVTFSSSNSLQTEGHRSDRVWKNQSK